MNIKRFTDYSLRILIYLALKSKETSEAPVTIKEVADSYSISKNHLMKVVQELSAKGYIRATRGKNGGLKLGKAAKLINIGEVVRMTEQDSTLVECLGDNNHCVITPACELKNILAKAKACFFESLDQHTLADLIKGKRSNELKSILLFP
ncbi:RrF2 family transcriptional regulator [Marinicellulosiphila megalodicopiae]|uniref:RrF2 family transcriptional regulator n=1 Tax=Marinicellulosiphila megalodicopiae TaxID=2724896 RepID=UPI003BAF2C23